MGSDRGTPRTARQRRRKADGGGKSEQGGQWEEQRKRWKLLAIALTRVGVGTLALFSQEVALSPAFNGLLDAHT